MKPMTTLVAFKHYAEDTALSINAQVLWIKLYVLSFERYNPKYLCLGNNELASMLACTVRTAIGVRDELIKRNLLLYRSMGTRLSGYYTVLTNFDKNSPEINVLNFTNREKINVSNFTNNDDINVLNFTNNDLLMSQISLIKSANEPKQAFSDPLRNTIRNSIRNSSTTYDKNTSEIYQDMKVLEKNEINDKAWMEFVNLYEQVIGPIPFGQELGILTSYFEDLDSELMMYALSYVKERNPRAPYQYLKAVLKAWTDKNIKTVKEAKIAENEFKQKKKTRHELGPEDEKVRQGKSPF